MQITKKQDKSVVTLNIALDQTEWSEALKNASTKIAEGVEIKGFRKGKAPMDRVAAQVGETRILSEASESAINQYYYQAVIKEEVAPIGPPKIAVDEVGIDKPLKFTAEITVMPELELGDYKKIKVKKELVEVKDEQINDVLKNLQRREVSFKEIEGEAKKGDWVEIDFEGKLDGVPFDGGKGTNHPLVIGDGVLLPDFEEALVGMKAGDEKAFPVNFPEGYHQSNLAGKKTEFTAKLHKVKEVLLPAVDDEFAKKISDKKSLQELKEDIKKVLLENAEQKERDRQSSEAIEQLIKISRTDIPTALVEQELDAMMHDFEHQLSHQGMNVKDYMERAKLTEEKMREEWKEQAKKRVIAGLALNEFKKREGIVATNEEVESEIARLKTVYPAEADKITEKYKSDIEKRRLAHLLSGQKAVEALRKLAVGE
ncbi:trigger factor [Patescibacteria group bacterium]|nr:trigger factor [Patescibacteria group bacterium]